MAEQQEEQLVVVTGTPVSVDIPTKSQFGALTSPTPVVWKNAFKITSIVTTAIAVYIGGSGLVPESIKVELLVGLKALDMLVFGIGRLFGVVPDTEKIEKGAE